MNEAMQLALSVEFRQLFVTIILFCDIIDPKLLWKIYWHIMSNDILFKLRKTFKMP